MRGIIDKRVDKWCCDFLKLDDNIHVSIVPPLYGTFEYSIGGSNLIIVWLVNLYVNKKLR